MRFACLALVLALGFALPVSAQQLSASSPAVRAAMTHVRAEASARGLSSADASDLVLSSAHTDSQTGISYVYLQQRIGSIDIAEAMVTVVVGRNGAVASAAGDLVSGTGSASKGASLSAQAALARAAAFVGEPVPASGVTKAASSDDGRTYFGTVVGDPVSVRPVYVATNRNGLRLAWEVNLPTRDTQHNWLIRVDAQTGAELMRYDLVVHDTFGSPEPARVSYAPLSTPSALSYLAPEVSSYVVYPYPLESPHHSNPISPSGARVTVTSPSNLLASPFGWHDNNGADGAEFTTTQGNNVHAYTDTDANNIPDVGSSPDGGAGLSFNFPVDITQDPSTYRPASVVNLFYWNNIIHDLMYQYGFTEAAGNFQTNNYGRGGAGNDYVQAESQDGSGTNNANFSTPIDGSRPRMQMYVGVDVSPYRDGSFDNGVVVHEYGHGISNRLTGGPAASACLQNAEQQGEGWSDFYAAMMTMQPGETRTTPRGIGTYLFAQGPNGVGIRLAPYSTDFAVNNYTYGRTAYMGAVHQIGFVWATILWEATWDMIDAHGYSPDLYNATGTAGNQMMMRLVTQGLKTQPCSPGFVSSRDAILAADALLYPDAANPGRGVHYTTLWNAFARRGLGASASQGVTSLNTDNVEAFDTPLAAPVMSYAPGSLSFALQTGQTDRKQIVITNSAAPGSSDLNMSARIANMTPAVAPVGPVATVSTPVASAASGEVRVRQMAPEAASREVSVPVLALQDVPKPTTREVPDGAKVLVDCAEGQRIDQFSATAASFVGLAGVEYGQSFTAPCTGFLPTIAPVINPANLGATWGATMRVYQGAGTLGTQLAATSFTFTNPTEAGVFLLNIDVSPVLAVTEGQVYTWFLDMTPTTQTAMQYTTSSVYPGGVRYRTANGDPAAAVATTGDMQFSVIFGSPNRWVTASPLVASAKPGTSSTLDVDVSAVGLANGTYTADIILTTNVPATPTITLPVTLVVGAAPGSATLDGSAGYYLMGSPTANTTVDQLSAFNLVAGVPGYYPTFGAPTLYTGYRNNAWTPSTGAGETIASGQGFLWYFFDNAFTPTEATTNASSAVAFPVTLTAPGAVNTADAPRVLHTTGNRINALGNPFGTQLDISRIATWPGGKNVASKGRAYVWDPALNTWVFGAAAGVVEPWQGFAVRAKANVSGSTLTIPASAASGGTPAVKSAQEDRRVIAFELEGTQAGTKRVLMDRALEVAFDDEGAAGWDDGDAEKLAPLASHFVSLGIEADLNGQRVLKASDSRPMLSGSFEVPLALETAGANAELTLRWQASQLPADWQVVLRDLVTGESVNLRTASAYTFEAASGARKAMGSAPELQDADASAATTRFVLSVETGISPEARLEANTFTLSAIVPNPLRGSAQVDFTLAESGAASVAVYDVQGREVARLADGTHEAGAYSVRWDASGLAPGIYVVRVASGGAVLTRRAVVLR